MILRPSTEDLNALEVIVILKTFCASARTIYTKYTRYAKYSKYGNNGMLENDLIVKLRVLRVPCVLRVNGTCLS